MHTSSPFCDAPICYRPVNIPSVWVPLLLHSVPAGFPAMVSTDIDGAISLDQNLIHNPLATILSLAMLLRYSFGDEARAQQIEAAVQKVLEQGWRTGDIFEAGTKLVGCAEMGDAVLAAL